MQLPGKNVVITGATGGIGSLLAKKMAEGGTNLYLLGRDLVKLKDLQMECGGKIIACDLTVRASRQYAINLLKTSLGRPDLLLNCAGIGIYKSLAKLTEKDWYSSYELNVHAPFFLLQNLDPKLTVSLGSCSAFHHAASRSLYNSTKAALRSLSLSLAKEKPGELVHITLDSTLTSFGSLSLADKKEYEKSGKKYLDPSWVADKIIEIIALDRHEPEYTLSPECYGSCGPWLKP